MVAPGDDRGRQGTPTPTAETDRIRLVAARSASEGCLPCRSSGVGQYRYEGVRHVPHRAAHASPHLLVRVRTGIGVPSTSRHGSSTGLARPFTVRCAHCQAPTAP